jgi:pimeloyl-ACP methyl ester carboxylesterase
MKCNIVRLMLSAGLLGVIPFLAWSAEVKPSSEKFAVGFRSVEIGDRSLRYMCSGVGSPTVIIEQAAGNSIEAVFAWKKKFGWAVVVPKVSRVTRVCVYDRAGLGNSSPLTNPRTSADSARDLHALLEKEGIAPPYVFAGHSFGGINARAFASEYRDAVKGMVLIDSATLDQQLRFARAFPPRNTDEPAIIQSLRDGPDRSMQGGEWYDFNANMGLADKLGNLSDMPLIVLTRSPNSTPPPAVTKEWVQVIEPTWQEMQAELTKLSSNSKQVTAKKAGHIIQAEEPELVVDAIIEVVKKVRARH